MGGSSRSDDEDKLQIVEADSGLLDGPECGDEAHGSDEGECRVCYCLQVALRHALLRPREPSHISNAVQRFKFHRCWWLVACSKARGFVAPPLF